MCVRCVFVENVNASHEELMSAAEETDCSGNGSGAVNIFHSGAPGCYLRPCQNLKV